MTKLYLGLTEREKHNLDHLFKNLDGKVTLKQLYDFMNNEFKEYGLYENCIALIHGCEKYNGIMVQRMIGW